MSNTKPRLYLHIGSSKTGSSAIQAFMAQNTEQLAARGFWYPTIGRQDDIQLLDAHHLLASGISFGATALHKAFFDKNNMSEYFSDCIEQLKAGAADRPQCATVLSSEYLWGLISPRFIGRISELTEDFDTKIIVYLRRQDLWLQSMYNERVKAGERKSFSAWSAEFLKRPRVCLNYMRILRQWASVVGRKNVIVQVYEKSPRPQDIYADFASVLSISDIDGFAIPLNTVNPSADARGMSILRFFNRLGTTGYFRNKIVLPFLIRRNRRTLHAPLHFMPADDAQTLLDRFQRSNDRVAETYFDPPRQELFTDPEPTIDNWKPATND